MPMRFGRAIVLSAIGGIATWICWLALWFLFWGPYWHQLNRHGMYVHDFDWVQLVAYGPIVVALVFFLTTWMAASFEKRQFESDRHLPRNRWRILFFGVFPGVIVFLLVSGLHRDAWRFPLSEAAACLIGMALGYLWVRWRRMDEIITSDA